MALPIPHPRTFPTDWMAGAIGDIRPVGKRGEVGFVLQPGGGGDAFRALVDHALALHFGVESSDGRTFVRAERKPLLWRPPRAAPRVFSTSDAAGLDRGNPRVLFAYGWRIKYHRTPVLLLTRDPINASLAVFDALAADHRARRGGTDAEVFCLDPLWGVGRATRLLEIWSSARLVPPGFFHLRAEDLALAGPEALADVMRFLGLREPVREHLEHAWQARPFCFAPATARKRLSPDAIASCLATVRPLHSVYGYGADLIDDEVS